MNSRKKFKHYRVYHILEWFQDSNCTSDDGEIVEYGVFLEHFNIIIHREIKFITFFLKECVFEIIQIFYFTNRENKNSMN